MVLSEPAVSLPRKSRPSPSSGTSILPQRVPSAIDSARCGCVPVSGKAASRGAALSRSGDVHGLWSRHRFQSSGMLAAPRPAAQIRAAPLVSEAASSGALVRYQLASFP